jgi:hypothetical protein
LLWKFEASSTQVKPNLNFEIELTQVNSLNSD